jgi:hypothetical protein
MRSVRNRIILFHIALILFAIKLNAQVVSSHDGFYPSDSVFYQLSGVDSFKYCVNCNSANLLHAYDGGVWLYSREHTKNTWENGDFTKSKSGKPGIERPEVVKGNTIWVRTYKGGKFMDEHHFVFLGKWKPKTATVVSIYVDSLDFMGPDGFYGSGNSTGFSHPPNYLLSLEKQCSYQIFGGKLLKLEAERKAVIGLEGMNSLAFANKTLQLDAGKTDNKPNFLVLGKSLTDSLGENIKAIRFFVGGTSYKSNIIGNDIATTILRRDIGGAPSTPVCVFINGSFWTYAMAQENIGTNQISKTVNIPAKQIVTGRVQASMAVPTAIVFCKKAGFQVTQIGTPLIAVTGYNMNRMFYSCYDTVQFEVDTNDSGYNPAAYDDICNLARKGNIMSLLSAVNRESFFRYALSVWFFQVHDAWGNSNLILTKAGERPWQLFAEHYDFTTDSADNLDWDKYFTYYHLPARDGATWQTLPWHITQRMLQYDPEYFCLVAEDELNTTYKAERTVNIATNVINQLRPCVAECSAAWADNGWPDSTRWEGNVAGMVPFFKQRPIAIAEALPKNFLTGPNASMTIKQMQEVKVKFDAVPLNSGITVVLNSLQLTSDFSGKYYPKPDLRVSLKYDTQKYKFVKWREYPNSPADFKISAATPITLTPEFVAIKK